MRTILGKLAFHRSIGLFVNEQEVSICVIGSTPFGRVRIHQSHENINGRPISQVVQECLRPWGANNRRVRVPVAIGIPQRMIFHGSHAITNSNRDASPESILESLLKSPSVKVDEMIVDLRPTQIGKRPIARITACRKKNIEPLLGALSEQDARLKLAEPDTSALVRVGELHVPTNARSGFGFRFFLSQNRGLAVLQHKRMPVSWKEFDWKDGEERPSILAAVSLLRTSSRHLLGEQQPNRLILHGREDLRPTTVSPEFALQAGVNSVDHVAGPDLDGETVAYGLALSCGEDDPDLDLVRRTKPLERIAEIFPWGEIILQLVFLGAVWLSLDGFHRSIQADSDALRAKIAGISWLRTQQTGELEKERAALDLRLKAIEGFDRTHTDWSAVLNSVGSKMSEKITLEQFIGQNELEIVGKPATVKIARSIVFRFLAQLDASGRVPKEVDDLVGELRNLPAVTADFPILDIVDLKTTQGTQGMVPSATFNVVCTPRPKKVAPVPESATH